MYAMQRYLELLTQFHDELLVALRLLTTQMEIAVDGLRLIP